MVLGVPEARDRTEHSGVITSTTNSTVKYIRSLYRREIRYRERVFVVEGLRTIEETFRTDTRPVVLFRTPALQNAPRASALLAQATALGVEVKTVSEAVMQVMADTVTPSGILGVMPMPTSTLPSDPLGWALIVDNLRDPGNLGTILRSALAAGVEWVLATPGTVDLFSPKVVRAAMGAHFRLHLCVDQPWEAICEHLAGMQVLLAEPSGGIPYWQIDWRQRTALVIGGEAEGATPEAEKLATGHVVIPMQEGIESLNAAVAAGVLLFEAARQRSFSI